MIEKQMKTRIVHKHDIETNWQKATNFVPKQGELIIYDDRYVDTAGVEHIVANTVRFKIGNGVDNVNDLDFCAEPEIVQITGASTTAVMSQNAVTAELDKKVTILQNNTEYPCLYQISTSGVPSLRILQNHWKDDESVLIAYSVVQRDDLGRIQVATPTKKVDAANKKYVDEALAALREELVAMIESSAQAAAEEIITTGEW